MFVYRFYVQLYPLWMLCFYTLGVGIIILKSEQRRHFRP